MPRHRQQQQSLRTEHQLKLWVLEAKNIPPKYRYMTDEVKHTLHGFVACTGSMVVGICPLLAGCHAI